MGSGSERGVKRLAPKLYMGPAEDVVQVLMETLVDPLMPSEVSKVLPSQDSQKSVAKQMQAVVLLYNYYHRKHEPDQVFLDFVSFCRLAVVIRPVLTAFITGSESKELNLDKSQVSLTEKAIMDACDVAACLDQSKGVPQVKHWPISKVVVLLIDSKKENCMLHFGVVTLGVWSPIEKELTDCSINLDVSTHQEQVGDKRKRCDDKFLQLGYDAVKDIAGIDSSELEVLESHVTYSLSKEKSAARLYMMQHSGSFNVKNQVPLKFLVESLQGPLVEKWEYGLWRTTEVVEYYHMLPYIHLISSWLSNCGTIQRSTPAPPVSECKGNDMDHIDENTLGMKVNSSSDKIVDSNNKSSGGKSASPFDAFHNDGKNGSSRIIQDLSKQHEKSSSSGPSQRTLNGINATENNDQMKDSTKREEGSLPDPCIKVKSKLRAYHERRKNNTCIQTDVDVKGDANIIIKVDSVESNRNKCGDGNELTNSSNQNVVAKEKQLVPFEAKTEFKVEASASEEVQNALALLYRKRQELYSQFCDMEDKLASYEDNITRIREHNDVDLARQCMKSILTGDHKSLLEHGTRNQDEKQTRLSKAIYLPGKSSCQDLEYTCLKNNWRLPRYFLELSSGKFISKVIIQGKDIKVSSKGGLELRPFEARESAAAQMIAKIRSIAAD